MFKRGKKNTGAEKKDKGVKKRVIYYIKWTGKKKKNKKYEKVGYT